MQVNDFQHPDPVHAGKLHQDFARCINLSDLFPFQERPLASQLTAQEDANLIRLITNHSVQIEINFTPIGLKVFEFNWFVGQADICTQKLIFFLNREEGRGKYLLA